MSMPIPRIHKRRSLFSRFRRNRDGATAVEFALVAIPFFWLMMGMAEIGAMSMVQSNMDNAMAEVGRTIRTGEVQTNSVSATQLKNQMCDNVRQIMNLDCSANLQIDVDRFDSFADADGTAPVAGGALDMGQMSFQPGGPGEVILVRAYYQWEILTPMFETVFANLGGGRRLIVTAMLFRNEPF
jgi:Flp pilus assembly protein TadG